MWDKLLKALGLRKNNKMEAADKQQLLDNLSKFKYQWIKTERTGDVCKIEDIETEGDIIWVKFTDKSRINFMLLEEFMIKMDLNEKELELKLNGPSKIQTNLKLPANAEVQQTKQVAPVKAKSAIKVLLEKQKPNIQQIDISLELNIPSESLYDVLMCSFDNAEEEILNHIIESLDTEVIKEAIKNTILIKYGKLEKNNA